MGLGYLTLSIKSEQDKYLTGNPQFTFFKSVYKRHTNFAIDYQFINFVGDSSNVFGKKVYIDIPKNGDLLHRMFLMIDIAGSNLTHITPVGYNFIEYVDLFIGGQRIDRHYGSWLQIWHELFEKNDVLLGRLVSSQGLVGESQKNTLYIPLRFWFNNNVGLSLPLIALQYNDIKFEIKFNSKTDIQTYNGEFGETSAVRDINMSIVNIRMLTEYIHLDKEERRLFASNVHEYLITQVQSSLSNPINLYKNTNTSQASFENIVHKTDLRFNHPVKELVWTFQDYSLNDGKSSSSGVYSNNFWREFNYGNDQFIGAMINLNGKDMTDELSAGFYRSLQNFQYHSGVGLGSVSNTLGLKGVENGNAIYSHSFSLSPEDYQPSGSINFSNIEQAQLKYRLHHSENVTSKSLNIYAVNYNIFRVMSGMASLAFSN